MVDFPFRFFLLGPLFFISTLIPLIVAIWVLLKIHSIDSTLKEISRKLDRLKTE